MVEEVSYKHDTFIDGRETNTNRAVVVKNSVFYSCRLFDCYFGNWTFEDVVFSECRFDIVDFDKVKLKNVRFQGCDFHEFRTCQTSFVNTEGIDYFPDAPARLLQVAQHIINNPTSLDMGTWSDCNACGTRKCIAGWGIHFAGAAGEYLVDRYNYEMAGLILLGPEAHEHFYSSDKEAVEYLEQVLRKETLR